MQRRRPISLAAMLIAAFSLTAAYGHGSRRPGGPPDGGFPDGDRPDGSHGGPFGGPRGGHENLLEAFDSNGDGAISSDELAAGLAAQQAAFLNEVDANGDGAISAEEIAATGDRLAEKLKSLDTDGDGAVSAAELAANLEKRKAEILAKLDTNSNGTISAEELAAYRPEGSGHAFWYGRSLGELDTNGDGTVSGDELAAGLAARQADWLKTVDTNGDGAISAEEIAALDDRLAAKVKALDTDGDGTVSAAELAADLEARKKDILARFDTNGDGAIGADELANAPHGCMDKPEEEAAADQVEAEALVLGAVEFLRGDANSDGQVDISDALGVASFLFLGTATPGCMDAADANDDGNVDLADAIAIVRTLFQSASAGIAAPYPDLGTDPTDDSLTCE